MNNKLEHAKIIKELHGEDCFKKWGKLGGNPILLKQKENKLQTSKENK